MKTTTIKNNTPRKLPEGSIQVTYKYVFPKSGPTPIPNKQYNHGLTTNLGPKKIWGKKQLNHTSLYAKKPSVYILQLTHLS